MLFIQVANIINELVQNDPDLKFYHYGLPSEVNINTPNNFDPNSETGRLFPYVLQIPREMTGRAQQNAQQSIFETHNVELLIIDTYAYQAQSFEYKQDTQLKIFSKLQVLAERIIKAFIDYGEEVAIPPFNVGDYSIDPDAARLTANTRMVRVNISLVFASACSSYRYNIGNLFPVNPEDGETTDKEDENDKDSIIQP